ncbi:MAG: hypothetical protein SGILL_003565 [Bacillariaceae sp.]
MSTAAMDTEKETEKAVSPSHAEEDAVDAAVEPSLIIPIKSGSKPDQFIEIFPEEMPDIPASTLLGVLKDEDADLGVWADAGLKYIEHKQHARDAAQVLEAACQNAEKGSKDDRVRIFAAAGIAHLTAAQEEAGGADTSGGKRAEHDLREELTSKADNRFTLSSKVDNLYPMTWIGKGMLNLQHNRLEQARFFFDTTLKECGKVLPALLGMASVMYLERNYQGAQNTYAEAIRLYPTKSGAATRVGFGLACYRLGQIDRAKASFVRALEMDAENVEAMVGAAVLDMMNLDETSSNFGSQMERAIKMISMANLLDPSNAMVQNHLANHYFWKWTAISGTVEVTQGSKTVKGSQPIPVDVGDRVRIGTEFEAIVADDSNEDEVDGTTFQLKDGWKGPSATGLKIWKKDYDRVIALAKGAYNSTSVPEIQAEALFLLARVYHVRGMMDDARKFYERSVKLSPILTPARFGLALVLIYHDEYAEAAAHLQLVLGTSNTASDAWATLGLLEVKAGGKKTEQGLAHLRKAIDLNPLDPDLILLEALALQQHESSYPKALEQYKKAKELMKKQRKPVTCEIYTNIGVLSHETRKFDESLASYKQALDAIDEDGTKRKASLDNVGVEGGKIRMEENNAFFEYLDCDTTIVNPLKGDDEEGVKVLKVIGMAGKDASDLSVKAGDDIRVGETFVTQVEAVEKDDGSLVLRINDSYKGEKKKKEDDAMDVDGESKDESAQEDAKELSVSVKRENTRLSDPVALSIAFNMARLHEASGKPLAAIELHKAILKRNPAYVNSQLRLACISIDCGALNECAGWLKIAAKTAPGNPEVLTLIGNLHLSLCDWAPAQQIFDGLLGKKVPNVEAYALLSMGNIYFANLGIPGRYAKHLGYAGDYYKRILTKDNANAYAANGLGTVLAEKADLFKAKEIFNRVRETTGDTIADAQLNLAHIYVAQKKHPEALQMYQSYLKRTVDGTSAITSKSRLDDKVDVLHYIAFAYFDWARQTEAANNAKAAPADERYKKAMENLQRALVENTSESKNSILTYNLCMTKLQAANCVLQKLTRNIRRTADEVEEALTGLQTSLETVETILKNKTEGAKVLISSSVLEGFVTACKGNIEAAKSHLEDERKREEETKEIRALQRITAESKREEQKLKEELKKKEEAKEREERDRRARQKMARVDDLRAGWESQQAVKESAKEKRQKKAPAGDTIVPDDAPMEEEVAPNAAALFDDSDDSDAEEKESGNASGEKEADANEGDDAKKDDAADTTHQDLFGDSSGEDSDEELKPTAGSKRSSEEKDGDDDNDEEPPSKKSRVLEESD